MACCHPVGTEEFVQNYCASTSAAGAVREKLDALELISEDKQAQMQLLRHCVAPTPVHTARSACERAHKHAIENTRGDITEFTAKLCGIESWEGHEKAKLRATLPLRCTGLDSIPTSPSTV